MSSREYQKRWKEANRERVREYSREYRKDPDNRRKHQEDHVKRKFERKQKAIEYLGGKCADCAGVFPSAAYDFHHRDMAQKEFNLSTLLQYRWELVLPELNKCDLLCANCHRIRHYDPKLLQTEGEAIAADSQRQDT